MATPVDFRHLGPLADVFGTTGLDVGTVLDSDGNVPPRVILQAFRSLTPTAEVTQYINLWERLWSDEYVSAYRAMTGWATDHVPFPGAAARQTVQMLVRDNAMMTDRLVLGGDRVRLTDITLPFLSVLGTRDHIIPEPASAPVIDLVGSTDKHELRLGGGHIGLVVGKTAARTTIPAIIDFLQQRSELVT
jgi:polyhydroxyalkanoate synthase subunit PhaC